MKSKAKQSKTLSSNNRNIFIIGISIPSIIFRRKLILSKTMLGFFNIENGKNEPTEWIRLNTIKNCSSKGEKIINGKKMYLLVIIYLIQSFDGEDKHS